MLYVGSPPHGSWSLSVYIACLQLHVEYILILLYVDITLRVFTRVNVGFIPLLKSCTLISQEIWGSQKDKKRFHLQCVPVYTRWFYSHGGTNTNIATHLSAGGSTTWHDTRSMKLNTAFIHTKQCSSSFEKQSQGWDVWNIGTDESIFWTWTHALF